MAPFQALTQYYRLTFHSNGSAGEFDFVVLYAHENAYMGDGSECGNNTASGLEQLTAVAEGIAAGIQAKSAPYWDNITLTSIEVQRTDVITLA
jgi:hypothetical protein